MSFETSGPLWENHLPARAEVGRLRGFGQGTRNDLAGFEEQGFIKGIDDRSRIAFDYRGIYRDVIESVSPADVRWTCQLLSRLTERQWNDAFRAGGTIRNRLPATSKGSKKRSSGAWP